MKIAIVTNQVPFVQGGAEFLVDNFKKSLLSMDMKLRLSNCRLVGTLKII
ncbi:MAG TPA: hypothetical protein PKG75_10385 [Clostridiales bacterium]|nr:hypothetical protein [Clostridiales bacterium]